MIVKYEIRVEVRYPESSRPCPACGDITEVSAVHAFCYWEGNLTADGAICDVCLSQPKLVRQQLRGVGDIPTLGEMARAREEELAWRSEVQPVYEGLMALLGR